MISVFKLFLLIFVLFLPVTMFSQQDTITNTGKTNKPKKDTVRVYYLQPVKVTADRNAIEGDIKNIGADYQSEVLNSNGYQTTRRGGNCTQDVYVDGFKRNDIKVTIDGEITNCACPNRMDAFATRINPMEISSVEVNKNSSMLQSGFGGNINYHRVTPQENFKSKLTVNTALGASQDVETMLGVEGMNQMINFRYATGKGYKDGDNQSLEQLYGYNQNYTYNYGSVSYRAVIDEISLGGGFNLAENIRFPYLQMDEKHSYTVSFNGSYSGHRFYINYTDHLMDNTLRANTMLMSTNAKTYTTGLTGEILDFSYDFNYRYWNADNLFFSPTLQINNRMIPNVGNLTAEISRTHVFDESGFAVGGKIGYSMTHVGQADYLSNYTGIFPDAKLTRNNIIAGASFGYDYQFNDAIEMRALGEFSIDNPAPEELYITVRKPDKPKPTPNWFGNPTLKQPVKFGGRINFLIDSVTAEGYMSYVSNYVNLYKMNATPKPYLTYANVNVLIAGFNVGAHYRYISTNISYIFGKNQTNDLPLSEIAPFSITTELTSPGIYGVFAYARHTYNMNQKRVDYILNETPSAAWNRIDLGLNYFSSIIDVNFEVINLLNTNYYNYLSFARNPFASGAKVFEPGRVFKLTLSTRYE